MTQPLPPDLTSQGHLRREPPTSTDRVHAEEAQVQAGTADGCGYICPGCHGGLTCLRAAHSGYAPHIGRDADGELVQWIGPCSAEVHAATQAQEFLDGAAT